MLEKLIRTTSTWLAGERACPCGKTHRITTRIVRLDDRHGSALIETRRALDLHGQSLIVSDINTRAVAADLATTLRDASVETLQHVFDSPALVADESSVAALANAVRSVNPQCVVGVGSGTINDICKTAATRRGIPYISYPTAASMNGYTSAVASLKRAGLKVTDPVSAPIAVVVDLDVVRRSPREMTAAGVADLLSKFVCNADWILANLLEGGYYCDEPARLATRAADAVIRALDPIAEQDQRGMATLSAALVLSGMSMAAAGSSSPASGGEHLISHYWDMCVPGGQRLHGAQVGLGTLLCARLYETLATTDPTTINPEAIAQRRANVEPSDAEIRDHFGPTAPAVVEQAGRKRRSPDHVRKRAAFIRDNWSTIWSRLAPVIKSTAHIRALLTRAGAPTKLRAINLNHADAQNAVRWARHIRARYTVFDFAADLGLFEEQNQRALLAQSGIE